jgi:hypothetical protein
VSFCFGVAIVSITTWILSVFFNFYDAKKSGNYAVFLHSKQKNVARVIFWGVI